MRYWWDKQLQNKVRPFIGRHAPRWLVYEMTLVAGIRHIKDNEIVPEVGYTEVLQRAGGR